VIVSRVHVPWRRAPPCAGRAAALLDRIRATRDDIQTRSDRFNLA